MKNEIIKYITDSKTILILGHTKPDGDCVGACLAMARYILNQFYNKEVNIYLKDIPSTYDYLNFQDLIINQPKYDVYDLTIALDCADIERIGDKRYFENAKKTINIDHHISNTKFGHINYIKIVSSTCEIIYELITSKNITKKIAQAIYTGIIYDTGIFRHQTTTKKTLQIASELIEFDINFSKIIDKLFYEKTYKQNKLLGVALANSKLILNDKCIYSYISNNEVKKLNIKSGDTEGIIDQLRSTIGVLCAYFIYEVEPNKFKISFRSNDIVDVCKIAKIYNGGGHIRAAGCSVEGEIENVINDINSYINNQLH